MVWLVKANVKEDVMQSLDQRPEVTELLYWRSKCREVLRIRLQMSAYDWKSLGVGRMTTPSKINPSFIVCRDKPRKAQDNAREEF
jgi:hypothetical protein